MDAKLQSIASLQNDSEKVVRYTELLREISIDASDEKSLVEQFVAHLLSVPSLQVSKQVFQHFSSSLESSMCKLDDSYKFTLFVKFAKYLLEQSSSSSTVVSDEGADESSVANSEMYLNRAKFLLSKCKDEESMRDFKLCDAIISDLKGRFVEAGLGYSALKDFRNAAICATLSKDSYQKTRLIAKLLAPPSVAAVMKAKGEEDTTMATDDGDNDEEGLLNILKSIQLGRIVDADAIKSKLTKPHHLNAFVAVNLEHNLLCVSKLYKSITLVELSNILKVNEREAERKGIEMISQGKFKGVFDQEVGLLEFLKNEEEEEVHALRTLTDKIAQVCDLITKSKSKDGVRA